MPDHFTNSVHVEAAWFEVRCAPARQWVRIEASELFAGPSRGQYVDVTQGCGYINELGKCVVKPAYMSKATAKKVAAKHRREHRKATEGQS